MLSENMVYITHQIFWTLTSFFLFFTLMRVLVIKNVVEISKKRIEYIEGLTAQVENMREKTQTLKNVTHKILYEEIPTKQKFYVEKKLEPVLHELEILELNEKGLLKERLAKHKVRHYKEQILQNEEMKKELANLAQQLLAKIEGEK